MLARFDTIDLAIQAALITVAESSQRVYGVTFDKWRDWCANNQIDPLDLRPAHVMDFLEDHHVTRKTRQRQLSAMRKLLAVLALNPQAPQMKLWYDILKMAKIPRGNLSDVERTLRALTPDEANQVLAVWQGDHSIHVRNQALIALLLATGMRRSEAVALQWRDVDLDNGTAIVRHGKGDKTRIVVIVGEYAIRALRQWKHLQGVRDFVFCRMDNRGRPLNDAPMSADNLYRIVRKTSALCGIDFSPHDFRRTLITDLLVQGEPTADVQGQAGHTHASTTLGYAQAADAQTRRKRFKTRYGR